MCYNTVLNAIWITLLNLTGDNSLVYYSLISKITTSIIALFATGLFSIPISILGSSFSEFVESQKEENSIKKGPLK